MRGPFRGLVDPNGVMASPNEVALDRVLTSPSLGFVFLSIDQN